MYHLRYPFSALKIIRDLLKEDGKIIIETAVMRSFKFSKLEKLPLLYCPVGKESPYEETSVTFFNTKGLIDSLDTLGYTTSSFKYMYETVRRHHISYFKKFKLYILQLIKGFSIDRITLVCSASSYDEKGVIKYWNGKYVESEIKDLKNPDNR